MLSACATLPEVDTSKRIKTGAPVNAPYGYVELCKREPTAPECGGKP